MRKQKEQCTVLHTPFFFLLHWMWLSLNFQAHCYELKPRDSNVAAKYMKETNRNSSAD